MKTKTFFFICLLSGIGVTQLSAQNGPNDRGAFTFHDSWLGLVQPIYCNGVWIDDLRGDLTTHSVAFFVGEVVVKTIEQFEGEYTSDKNGEKFKIISCPERDYYYTPLWYNIWHFNLLGTSGTRYIGSMYVDVNGGFKTSDGVCVEKGPKK